jgi:putative addiction module component (TIGR02574 family)
MNARVKGLGSAALGLTADERLELVDDILASLGDTRFEHDAEWIPEIEARSAADDRGDAELIPAETVFAKYRSA